MKETIEYLISEINEVLEAKDEDLFNVAERYDLDYGICCKLLCSPDNHFKLRNNINDLGREYIEKYYHIFDERLESSIEYCFDACCNMIDAKLYPKLGRLSLEARKTVLEGILKELLQ